MKHFKIFLMLAALSACTVYHPPSPYLPSRDGLQSGETITVKNNENIYSIAHEHNVSMRELIVLNNLKPPFEVRPGQSIVLPAGGSSFAGDMKPPEAAPLAPVEKNDLMPISPASVSSQQLEPITPANPPPQSYAAPPANTASPFSAPSTGKPQPLVIQPSSNAQPSSLMQAAPNAQGVTTAEPVQALNRPALPQKQIATTTSTAPANPMSSQHDLASTGDHLVWFRRQRSWIK
jgi:lipoprotein NlpD